MKSPPSLHSLRNSPVNIPIAFLLAGPEASLVSTSQEAHVLEIFPCGVVVQVTHGQEDLLASDVASVMEIVFSFLTGHSHRPQIRLEKSS